MNKGKKKIDTCLLCGEERPLSRAHILQNSCKEFMADEDHKIARVSLDGQSKKVQSLPFNKSLFCPECDNSFSDSEKELKRFSAYLVKGNLKVERQKGSRVSINDLDSSQDVLVQGFNVLKIKKSLLFLLYKLHLDISIIDLGEMRGSVLGQMLHSDILDATEFGICLAHYRESEKFSGDNHKKMFFLAPGMLQSEKGMFISILLPGALMVMYRIDRRLVCGREVGINLNGELCGYKREINQDSKDFFLSVNTDGFDFDKYYFNEAREILQRGGMTQKYPMLG